MPYIKEERRKKIITGHAPETAGELNFIIFHHVKYNKTGLKPFYVLAQIRKFLGKTPNYQKYNDLTGCLVCCYNECVRRLDKRPEFLMDILEEFKEEIAAYEDKKILENGDV